MSSLGRREEPPMPQPSLKTLMALQRLGDKEFVLIKQQG